MPRTNEPGRTVASRLLQLLFAFRPGRSRLTLAQLTRLTGMPHATVHRFAAELLDAGLLDRAPDGSFTIGIRLWELGALAPYSVPLRTAAMPFLTDLATALGQHVQLAVLDGREAVIVELMSAPHAADIASRVGWRLPLHCSGVGKVLLAHAAPDLLDQLLEQDLPAYTARTCTDPDRLRRVLVECRATGTAVVREELTPGRDSVATRIIDADGHVVAALSVVVRTGSTDLRAITPSLITSGLGISRRLGWTPAVGVHRSGDP
jgi:DNA-binding IclR family transcriptional regulator